GAGVDVVCMWRCWPLWPVTTSATAWPCQRGVCPVFDLYIAIANIVFFFGLLGAYLLRSAIIGRLRHARTDADGGSVFLNKRTMEMVYWLLEPIIDFLAALRITPNMVTLFSLLP